MGTIDESDDDCFILGTAIMHGWYNRPYLHARSVVGKEMRAAQQHIAFDVDTKLSHAAVVPTSLDPRRKKTVQFRKQLALVHQIEALKVCAEKEHIWWTQGDMRGFQRDQFIQECYSDPYYLHNMRLRSFQHRMYRQGVLQRVHQNTLWITASRAWAWAQTQAQSMKQHQCSKQERASEVKLLVSLQDKEQAPPKRVFNEIEEQSDSNSLALRNSSTLPLKKRKLCFI
mmetsp:Transcript_3894/g.5414  ORF Transcript_3894/g.5414 Transcript_3894/m.5414 type:complete len:228 (+) Transcript_3894:62-745(+)